MPASLIMAPMRKPKIAQASLKHGSDDERGRSQPVDEAGTD
jgi:hypothetical protein